MKQEVDEATGQEAMVVIDHKEDLHPQVMVLESKNGEVIANYPIPSGAHIVVQEGAKIPAGALMAKTPRKTSKTKDITGGLPRVAELLRHGVPRMLLKSPKWMVWWILVPVFVVNVASSSEIPIPERRGAFDPDCQARHRLQRRLCQKGPAAYRRACSPHEILEVCGPQELQEHLVNEVQEVYRLQG